MRLDGTAGAHHVEAGGFRSTLSDLAAHTVEARAQAAAPHRRSRPSAG